ncbi:helix-turn-helix domain-containing protein [Streptomyces sp. NPDC005963]|uniref:helix-turn-helix domain-containing protein n=1 Tax=Streptomyces sp. NPDC005963 TaxID=3156721 RepID=UPI0033DE9FA1
MRVPGRKLGPIIDGVGVSHRAWLQVLRERYFVSGLTIAALARQAGWSKSKTSELLRGTGLYPTWELTHSLAHVLGLPTRPMQLLWREAAADAGKKQDWIEGCIGKVVVATGERRPPLEYRAFTELCRPSYTAYSKAFLPTGAEARRAVAEALVILWVRWDEALVSSGVPQFAWPILRWSVMARAPHTDGRPELASAAFDTVALARADGSAAMYQQFEESLSLFRAICRLPDLELDVTVLAHLRGMDPGTVADLLGLPPALITLTDDRAQRALTVALAPTAPEK